MQHNTTTDGLKNLQISYNILNLPQSVTQSGTTKATYGWFADGTKYSVLDAQGNGYYYIGSLILESKGLRPNHLKPLQIQRKRAANNWQS